MIYIQAIREKGSAKNQNLSSCRIAQTSNAAKNAPIVIIIEVMQSRNIAG